MTDNGDRYAKLRGLGQMPVPHDSIATLRRLAKRDGLRLTSWTVKDEKHFSPATYWVALVAADGKTILQPDKDPQ